MGSAAASADPFPHADAGLERYLPGQIGTVELLPWSLAGPDVPPGGGDMCLVLCGNEPREFADALGIPLDRVTVAVASSENLGIGAIAFRAEGVATTAGRRGCGDHRRRRWRWDADPDDGCRPRRHVPLPDEPRQHLIPTGDVLVFLYGEPPMTAEGGISPTGTVRPELVALIDAVPR